MKNLRRTSPLDNKVYIFEYTPKLMAIIGCNHINQEVQILIDNCHDICCHLPDVVQCQVNLVYNVHVWCSVKSGRDAGVDHYYPTNSRTSQPIGLIFMLKRLGDSVPVSFQVVITWHYTLQRYGQFKCAYKDMARSSTCQAFDIFEGVLFQSVIR